jgi:hypothetical protein
MENLWLAIVIYTVGLALILTLRPPLMFNENGTWKEFGYQRTDSSRHTIFPFWLFAVAWAFVSYAIAAAIGFAWMPIFASGSMAIASRNNVQFNLPEEIEHVESEGEEEELDDVFGTPVSAVANAGVNTEVKVNAELKDKGKGAKKSNLRSGYYVIDPASKENGLRTYIYYGKEKPT